MEDLYAIGIQELVDLNAVNVTIDTRSQVRQILFRARNSERVVLPAFWLLLRYMYPSVECHFSS